MKKQSSISLNVDRINEYENQIVMMITCGGLHNINNTLYSYNQL